LRYSYKKKKFNNIKILKPKLPLTALVNFYKKIQISDGESGFLIVLQGQSEPLKAYIWIRKKTTAKRQHDTSCLRQLCQMIALVKLA